MARNSIIFSVLFLVLFSISPSLESDDVMRFARNHLKTFGYFGDYALTDDTSYDEALVSALRKYQTFFGLNVTGRIEPATLKMMSRPRCGVPDHPLTGDDHNITLRYAFYDGKPRWHVKHLTYYIVTKPRLPAKTVKAAVASAFSKWSHASGIQFKEVTGLHKSPPIHIGTYSGDHGDGQPFDGRYGILAHAFVPPRGILHFDADEEWGTVQAPDIVDLESVALHEIGHLLGLAHSNVESSVMFPSFDYGQIRRNLGHDDIDGIRDLYPD